MKCYLNHLVPAAEMVRPATVWEIPTHSARFSTVIDMRNDQHARCTMHMNIAVMWVRRSGLLQLVDACSLCSTMMA